MAVLESCPKHNMVAYLEKTDGNTEFHEIISFLTRSSIHNALTVSPVVSTTFIEQFWMSAKSKIINNVRYITAKVAGKPVSISEASIRSDLLFDDADGIDSLPNQAIFDDIQLMGYEGDLTVLTFNKALFSPQWRFLFHTMNHCLSSKSTSWDQIPTNIATADLVGIKEVSDKPKKFKHLKAQIKKLKKKAKPVITHHRAWMKSVSLKQRLARKKSFKIKWMQKESVSKQGRKSVKAEPTVHKDKVFDELNDDEIDNKETEDAQEMGRTRYVVHEEKERKEKEVSTEDALSTDKEKDCTDRPDEGTDKQKVSTDKEKNSTDRPDKVLLNMSQAKAVLREKQKGVELKDIENIERPRPTSTRSLLTLKPLLKIDPKDKGKKKIEEDESNTESEDINESKKKFKKLAHDREIERKVQEDWEAEEEVKKLAEEEATNAALIQDFDDIKARIKADRLLALRLQEERESKQRAVAIRNRPPTRTQLRSQMMTYLKHVGNKKHSDMKNKTFEEIQALYEKVKRFDESFTVIGSTEDERKIKEMNEGASDPDKKKKFVKEDISAKVPAKQDIAEQGTKKRKCGHMKMIAGKRKRPQPDVDIDDEHRKCLKIVTFEGTIDSEIMERKSVIARLNKVSSPDGDYLIIYRANGNFRAFNYLMEVLHIFDRQDLFHLYDLVMKQYSEVTLEGIELILWGDLKIMMESSTKENDQKLEDGTVIHMLVERSYPLSKDLLQRMLDFRLEVEIESTAALDLIRVLNSPCFMVMSWLVQDQTVLGKDYSNLLIVCVNLFILATTLNKEKKSNGQFLKWSSGHATWSGWRKMLVVPRKFLASTVSSRMAYFVTILTPDSARSCVMQCILPTQGMRSIISTVFISPEGSLPSILLLVVIIVTVIIVVVTVILVVVVVAIIEDSPDKASLGDCTSSNFTLQSSVQLLRENTDSIRVSLGPVFLFGLSILAMVAACASRAGVIYSNSLLDGAWSHSCVAVVDSGGGVVDLNGDEDPTDEDGDIGMGDSTGVSASLGGEIFSGGKKCGEIKHW
ncbi:hypothetical protein Tco_1301724 [Tanacetum coccineum]